RPHRVRLPRPPPKRAGSTRHRTFMPRPPIGRISQWCSRNVRSRARLDGWAGRTEMTDTRRIAITVNGNTYERRVETRLTLGDFLRHGLRRTGPHLGCEHGVRGACTGLVDGPRTRSWLMRAVPAHQQRITPAAGLRAR